MVGIWLLTGIWVWIAAPTAAVIGASGVVYGLGAFLFFNGVFKRDRRSLMLSLVIAIFYGSMVVGIFPGKTGVSWESHLFGALAGIAMAWGFRKKDIQPRKRYHWEDEPEQEPQDESAPWNYRQNWPGSSNYYVPGESNPQDPFKEYADSQLRKVIHPPSMPPSNHSHPRSICLQNPFGAACIRRRGAQQVGAGRQSIRFELKIVRPKRRFKFMVL